MSKHQMLDRFQLRSLSLAGTVAIPSPFPELGKIFLQAGGVIYQGASGEATREDLVVIEHMQSHRVTVTRRVFLRDVAAVAFCPLDTSMKNWYFGPEIVRELRARSNSNNADLMMGIAYVRETAPVLMDVEVGMTAAESAEYYPPVLDRSDSHYDLLHPYDCSGGCHEPKCRMYLTPCHEPKARARFRPCNEPPMR
jgi:hypothetical protein